LASPGEVSGKFLDAAEGFGAAEHLPAEGEDEELGVHPFRHRKPFQIVADAPVANARGGVESGVGQCVLEVDLEEFFQIQPFKVVVILLVLFAQGPKFRFKMAVDGVDGGKQVRLIAGLFRRRCASPSSPYQEKKSRQKLAVRTAEILGDGAKALRTRCR